ncbi:MAG: hypothetical protein ACKO96_42050, partial [Flammeovirgaceae bacterium]
DPFNVGHTFLSIEQEENKRTLGFYPANSAYPSNPSDYSQLKDNAGKSGDLSVTFEISAQELDRLLNYIKKDTPNTYHLNDFNCTNWVVEACARMGIDLPKNSGWFPGGGGLCPGQFGEDMRNFTLDGRAVTKHSSDQSVTWISTASSI